MTYRFSRRAKSNIDEIWDYIAADSVDAADQMVMRLVGAMEQLVQFPRSARVGLVEGTRELVIAPYRITYKIDGDLIYIISVHGKRRR